MTPDGIVRDHGDEEVADAGFRLDFVVIAAQLNVAYVLEGSVRKADIQTRVTAPLIDARTDVHEWSETFDREFREIFAIQDEIARGNCHSPATGGPARPGLRQGADKARGSHPARVMSPGPGATGCSDSRPWVAQLASRQRFRSVAWPPV